MGTPVVLGDRVLVATTTTGTGTYSLGSAVTGFLDFAGAGLTTGARVPFVVVDSLTAPTTFEIGEGVYTSGSPSTLSRAQVRRNTTGGTSAVNWGAGTKYIMLAPNAGNLLTLDSAGKLSLAGDLAVAGVLAVTGAASFAAAVTLAADPANPLEPATKQYVDAASQTVVVASAQSQVEFTVPAGWTGARIEILGLVASTTAQLNAQFRRSGQGSYDASGYLTAFDGAYAAGAGGGSQSSQTAMQCSNLIDATWPLLSRGVVHFGGASVKATLAMSSLNVFGANGIAAYDWASYAPNAGVLDRLRFFFSTGNISAGTFIFSRL